MGRENESLQREAAVAVEESRIMGQRAAIAEAERESVTKGIEQEKLLRNKIERLLEVW